MLLFNKEDCDIFNLDNMTRIYPDDCYIRYDDNRNNNKIMVICEDSEEAMKVIEWIFHRMTLGNGNAILDLDEFRETETAKTRKALRNNKCNTCIYVDTDGCKQWDNDGTGCDAHITEEEAIKDVNEEK